MNTASSALAAVAAVGADTIVASAGDTATGPAFVPHSFTNIGRGTLRLIGIHASATIIQTFLSDD